MATSVLTQKFGPGEIFFGTSPAPGDLEFSCQVTAVTVGHEYEEITEAVKTLGGCEAASATERADSLTISTLVDLTESGFYNYLWTNDLTEKTITYTPNAGTASWSGTTQLRLPTEVVGEEFGGNLTGDLELPIVGLLAFTADADPIPPA